MKKRPLFYYVLITSGLLLLGQSSVLAADFRSGLVTYWPLDLDNGGTTPDMAAYYGNSMTEFNAPTLVPGQFGNAFSLNGSSQYLDITHGTDNSANGLPIYSSAKGYSITLWVKGAAQTTHYLFTEANTVNNNPLLLIETGTAANTNSHLAIQLRNNGGGSLINNLASTSVVLDNTWHHVAWVDDHGNAKLYVDGNLDGTNYKYNWPGYSSFSFNSTAIGALVRSAVSGYFAGQIDEVALWERALSQDEVNQVRTNGIVIPAAATILSQPADSTNAPGRRVALSVSAVGTPPVSFQWFKDGAAVDAGTSRTLVLTNLTAAASNNFSVQISNGGSPVTSDPAPVVTLADPPASLTNGIVSYWPMDAVVEAPGLGTNTPDIYYSHTDLALTNMGGDSVVAGQYSNALSFASTLSQYGKRIGGTPIYSTTNYTVSCWVNGNSGQANKMVFAEGGTSDYFLLGTENSTTGDGLLNVKSSSTPWLNDVKSRQVVFDGAWHHVVWVDENGAGRLYVDGVVDATDYSYNRSNLTLNATCVGALYRASAGLFLFGSVDEVALWNRALTWTEIQQVRTVGVPLPEPRIPVTLTQQPIGSTNHLGDRVIFSVTVSGTLPFSFQWRKDGAPVSGATDRTLTLLLTAAATNDYTVVITNIANSVTSSPAHLVVLSDPAPDLTANLLNYWPLDTVTDPPNPTSPDLASQDDLLLSNMDNNNLVLGQFGNALSFDGSTQYGAQAGGFPVYLLTNYSVSMWVKGDGTAQSDKRVFSEGSTANALPLFSINNDPVGASASACFYLRNDAGTTLLNSRKSTRPVFDNTWHHILWVDENGKARLYVDGVLDETDFTYSRTGTFTLNTTGIGTILRAATDRFFAGLIDDVATWGRALSWTEIGQAYTAHVPVPTTAISPSIFAEPADLTNFFFASTSFGVLASGTGPLSFQWRKDAVDIPAASNPSATNATLTFGGMLPASAAGGYSVVVANNTGAVTSRVAQLTLINDSLKVDFDSATSTNPQPGFARMTLGTPSVNLSGIAISVSAIGGITLADRDRNNTPGAFIVNKPPFLSQAQIYNDFIFGNNNATVGAGINVLIEHLVPNTVYGVTLWSLDPQSVGARVSDWTEIASGTTVPIATGYTFNGSVQPVNDYEDTLGGLLTSSPQGRLQIQGVKSGGDFAVFLNALRIEANPTPTSRILGATVVNGNLRLVAVGQYPGQSISFEQNTSLVGGAWVPAVGANPLSTNGMVITVEFPTTETQLFYRAVSPILP